MNGIGYVRVSTERQAQDDRTSLADQRASIEALAKRLGVSVERWYDDPGVSGATVEKRPGFSALLAHCASHPRPRSAPGLYSYSTRAASAGSMIRKRRRTGATT
jgi:hypothetical protein